jgi:hypothetical protein
MTSVAFGPRAQVTKRSRDAVGEGVKSCPRAGCGKSACPRSGVRNPGHLCASKCCPACSRYGESGGSIDEWRDAARHGQRYGRMT